MYYSAQGNWLQEAFPKFVQFKYLLVMAIVIGVSIGGATGLLEKFAYSKFINKFSFGVGIVIRTTVFLVVLLSTAYFIGLIFYINISLSSTMASQMSINYFFTDAFFVVLIYATFVSALLDFILQVNKRFGPGRIWHLLTGKYFHPVEENRIFMFIDLTASTSIAEKLGHLRFSKFLQSCFSDLSDVLLKHNARLYQFVGDEAVVTWRKKQGIENDNCFKLFFEFKKSLERNKEFYLNHFGIFPKFKASVNLGDVTVAEVGMIKSEIAFHGDVVNTTSRVLDLCKLYKQELLITKQVANAMNARPGYQIDLIDKVALRGKNRLVSIFAVSEREIAGISVK
jgi:adenylate cyclase